MSYVRKAKVFSLEFGEDTGFPGLDMRTKSPDIEEFSALGLKLQEIGETMNGAGTLGEQLESVARLKTKLVGIREMFAHFLISWSMMEEDGTPTPATVEGVSRLDSMEFLGLITTWLTAIGGVENSLGKDFGSGGTSPELSDLMESLSQSQAS